MIVIYPALAAGRILFKLHDLLVLRRFLERLLTARVQYPLNTTLVTQQK